MKLFGNNLTFNGNKIYHEANKPVASDIAFEDGKTLDTKVNEIKSSIVNNASQITFTSTQGLEATNVSEALDELHELASQPGVAELKQVEVTALPQTGQPGTIYMKKLPLEEAGADDKYEAYIWVNNSWETLGSGPKRTEVYNKTQTFSKQEIMDLFKANNTQKLIIRLSSSNSTDLTGVTVTLNNLTTGETEQQEYNGTDDIFFLVPYMERYRIDFSELPGLKIYPFEGVASVGIKYIRGHYSESIRYGIRINKKEADPKARVEYIEGAKYMTPMTVNLGNKTVDEGSWADVWFIRFNRPCMLNPNGTVDYYLNEQDQKYDVDNNYIYDTVSPSLTQSTMMSEIPLGYLYEYEDEDYTYHIVSNTKVDENYQALAFTDEDGTVKDKAYVGCQFAIEYNGRLVSYPGSQLNAGTIKNNETDFSRATVIGKGWHLHSYSMFHYLRILTTMVFKTTDLIATLGYGYKSDYLSNIQPGRADYNMLSGRFVPQTDYNYTPSLPRAFYIEGLVGNVQNVLGGFVTRQNTEGGPYLEMVYKPTPPFSYAGTGEGWNIVKMQNSRLSGYITELDINETMNGLSFPSKAGGNTNTYFASYFLSPYSNSYYSTYGGHIGVGGRYDKYDTANGMWSTYAGGETFAKQAQFRALRLMYV